MRGPSCKTAALFECSSCAHAAVVRSCSSCWGGNRDSPPQFPQGCVVQLWSRHHSGCWPWCGTIAAACACTDQHGPSALRGTPRRIKASRTRSRPHRVQRTSLQITLQYTQNGEQTRAGASSFTGIFCVSRRLSREEVRVSSTRAFSKFHKEEYPSSDGRATSPLCCKDPGG